MTSPDDTAVDVPNETTVSAEPRPAELRPAERTLGRADRHLALVQARIDRLTPLEAAEAVRDGALLIDLRPTEMRWHDGEVPGAINVSRHVLEWRLDPEGDHRLRELRGADQPLVLLCSEGYASSLAVEIATEVLGLTDVADVIGGFVAWRDAGLGWIRRGELTAAP